MSIIKNRYGKIYYNLISKVQTENRSKKDRYFESHHILPKSLGGTNQKTNLVLLTPREHYIAHLLLVRCVEKKSVYKMISALIRFKKQASSSRSYSLFRITLSKYSKGELNPSFGKIWIHHSTTNEIKYIPKKEFSLMSGEWVKGLPFRRGGYSNEYIWFHRGDQRTAVHYSQRDEYLKNGWILGRNVKLSFDHYKKMSNVRHSAEKDKKHSKELTGRITIRKANETNCIRVKPIELEHYLSLGYIIHKNSGVKSITSAGKKCSINGIEYTSISNAAKKLNVPYGQIYRKIKDNNFPNYRFLDANDQPITILCSNTE